METSKTASTYENSRSKAMLHSQRIEEIITTSNHLKDAGVGIPTTSPLTNILALAKGKWIQENDDGVSKTYQVETPITTVVLILILSLEKKTTNLLVPGTQLLIWKMIFLFYILDSKDRQKQFTLQRQRLQYTFTVS